MRNLFWFLLLPAALFAQREPVLKQIDLPHPYYYREMYLPQLTSGPSWVTWSPDSKEVIYSMAGSLWRQKIDSTEAVQLTDGPGFDYQPDWSHDGKFVVYTKYYQDAMELWVLDLGNSKTSQLTKDSAVNVEPRWSPDGKRIAYVSTALTKHFHIFLIEMDGALPKSVCGYPRPSNCDQPSEASPIRQLTKENVSSLPRYYYSKFDHEISPAWSPDGKDIVFVSNHGHIHGTGGIWRATIPESGMIDTATNAKEIHYEETNWKARPEFSPDGKRIVYASYLGREWHQLWLMPANGGDVFPLTYGDYDNINPRWSPDGKSVGYINNARGGLRACLKSLDRQTERCYPDRNDLLDHPLMRRITIEVNDGGDHDIAARISNLHRGDQENLFPTFPDIFFAADDSYDRKESSSEVTYSTIPFAAGEFLSGAKSKAKVQITKGLEYAPLIAILEPKENEYTFSLKKIPDFRDHESWQSGDLHVHANYAGAYKANKTSLHQQMSAENLDLLFNLVVNKEQRFPDIEWYEGYPDGPTMEGPVRYGQEFHTSYWGHLGLLNIHHLIIPGYAGYPNTAAASLVPMNADVADMAHAQNKDALVGWVHPFDELPDPYKDAKLTNELPIDVALGKVDYYEVLGFSDHKSSAAIWYRLLNLGFHLPAGAGTDAMTNFASLRGPVGLNRVYVNVSPGPLRLDEWLKNLKAGKTFATNGPLLRFSLGGEPIGGEVKLAKAGEVPFAAALRSIVPVDKVEVVCDGSVARTLFPTESKTAQPRAAVPPKSKPRSFALVSRARPPQHAQNPRELGTPVNARESSSAQDDAERNDGEIKDSQGHAATTSLDVSGSVAITKSGWCVLRAYSDHAEEPIMDIYPYGTTSPIYVTIAGERPRSPEDAKFFSKWIERVREDASVHPDYNTPQEREHVLKVLDEAAGMYGSMQKAGNRR